MDEREVALFLNFTAEIIWHDRKKYTIIYNYINVTVTQLQPKIFCRRLGWLLTF